MIDMVVGWFVGSSIIAAWVKRLRGLTFYVVLSHTESDILVDFCIQPN
jgi:hypothetical protein